MRGATAAGEAAGIAGGAWGEGTRGPAGQEEKLRDERVKSFSDELRRTGTAHTAATPGGGVADSDAPAPERSAPATWGTWR